jgi:hypothetical protein
MGKHWEVAFEIEGTHLADMFHLNKENLEEMILVAFDHKSLSPLFDGNLDAKVSNIEIQDIE